MTQSEQVIEVNGVRLIRRWGENRFQPLKSYKSREEISYRPQSEEDLMTEYSKARQDVSMDLRDSADLAFARRFVDTLIPISREGFYHGMVENRFIGPLLIQINLGKHPDYPPGGLVPQGKRKDEQGLMLNLRGRILGDLSEKSHQMCPELCRRQNC